MPKQSLNRWYILSVYISQINIFTHTQNNMKYNCTFHKIITGLMKIVLS